MISEQELVERIDILTTRRLRAWMREGWVRPTIAEKDILFSDLDAARIELICELRQEMKVNDAAMPVVLSLLDQVYGLRHQMRSLLQALENQPAKVRREIARNLQDSAGG